MSRFHIEVSYTQLAVFDPQLQNPFNDWTDEHVAQGFSWRPGSVSFGTLKSAGDLSLRIVRNKPFEPSSSTAERTISVLFRVPMHGRVEIASVGVGAQIEIPPGDYELVFEHGRSEAGEMWANLYFRTVFDPVRPRVVRADSELSPPDPLVMSAESA